jgi:hypothetical protein
VIASGYDAGLMRCYRVSIKINHVENDHECYRVSIKINHVENDHEECSGPIQLAQVQEGLFQ